MPTARRTLQTILQCNNTFLKCQKLRKLSCSGERLWNLLADSIASGSFAKSRKITELASSAGKLWTLYALQKTMKCFCYAESLWNFLAVQETYGTFLPCRKVMEPFANMKPITFSAVQETHELSCCVGNIWTFLQCRKFMEPSYSAENHGIFLQCKTFM